MDDYGVERTLLIFLFAGISKSKSLLDDLLLRECQ